MTFYNTILVICALLGVFGTLASEIATGTKIKWINNILTKILIISVGVIGGIWATNSKDQKSTIELNAKLAHQDSISQKLVDSLTKSLSLTKEFKQSSTIILNRLGTNLVNQSTNLNEQEYLMKKTSNLLLYPFFPIKMEIILKVKPNFNESDKKTWNGIKSYLKNNPDSVNASKDFSIETADFSSDFSRSFSTENLLMFTSHDPYDKKIITDYNPQLNLLNKLLFNKILPQIMFYVTKDKKTSKIDEYNNSIYMVAAAYDRNDEYLTKQRQSLSNCRVEYYINLDSDEITYTYITPINLSASNAFNSLYDIPNGSLYLSIDNNFREDISLTEIIFSCGNKPETICVLAVSPFAKPNR